MVVSNTPFHNTDYTEYYIGGGIIAVVSPIIIPCCGPGSVLCVLPALSGPSAAGFNDSIHTHFKNNYGAKLMYNSTTGMVMGRRPWMHCIKHMEKHYMYLIWKWKRYPEDLKN